MDFIVGKTARNNTLKCKIIDLIDDSIYQHQMLSHTSFDAWKIKQVNYLIGLYEVKQ